MIESIEQFLSGLKGVNRSGEGWVALCPAHADRRPSLSVGRGADGKILLKCHRGCTMEAILTARGLSAAELFPGSRSESKRIEAVPQATYDYRDENGNLIYRVVRAAGKRFSQCRPDGQGGWIWNLTGVERTLYRLPELRAAVDQGATIFIPEGEKDVETLRSLGLAATCNSGGAGKWPREASRHLKGARVVILPDNDEPGREQAASVASLLQGVAAEIRILTLPDLPEKGDITDWVARLGSGGEEGIAEILRRLTEDAPLWDPADIPSLSDSSTPTLSHSATPPRSTAAMELTRIGQEAELFHSRRGEPFARIPVKGRREVRPLTSRFFSNWLGLRYFQEHGKPPASESVSSAVSVLTGVALFESPQIPLSVRVAPAEGDGIWYDLADDQWRAVRIDSAGWSVVDEPPILFRRYAAMAAQAEPAEGGSIEELRPFLNLSSDADWSLLVAWLVAGLMPGIAHPVLAIHGEQGSSKSTTARLLGKLMDPSLVALRAEPRELSEWIQAADHSWLVSLDNLSRLPSWLSDALCRAVTGEAFLKRTLYTNDDDSLTEFQRVVILTGIETVVQRPDLLDRSILLGLEPIFPDRRRSEKALLEEFEAALPRLFGALLTLVARALAELPGVVTERLPRLADFARVGLAVERVCGWPEGTFKSAYNLNAGAQYEEAIASSPVAEALIQMSGEFTAVVQGCRYWEGTATELLEMLTRYTRHARPINWPRDAHALTGQLRRLAPSLRAAGVAIEYERRCDSRLIRIAKHPPAARETK